MSKRIRNKALKLGLPSLKKRNNTNTNILIHPNTLNSNEEHILKFMTKSDIYRLYKKVEALPKKIVGIDFEFITFKNVRDAISPSDIQLFNILYTEKGKKYSPTNIIIKIKKISFNDGTNKTYKTPIYFFKSTGKSRAVSNNKSQRTKNIWFPTNTYPFEMNFGGIDRITKLEDSILRSGKKNKDINIQKYGRFLNLEMSMISFFLTNLFK